MPYLKILTHIYEPAFLIRLKSKFIELLYIL